MLAEERKEQETDEKGGQAGCFIRAATERGLVGPSLDLTMVSREGRERKQAH